MDEYIKRDDALQVIESCAGWSRPLESVYEEIQAMPAADIALVVRGIPVRKNRESREVVYLQAGEENGEILYKRYVYVDKTDWVEYCSVCGKRLCSRFNNYCPNCGAKMDKEEA